MTTRQLTITVQFLLKERNAGLKLMPIISHFIPGNIFLCLSSDNVQGGQKNGPFLNVDNFAMVCGRKACDMSKVCKFCLKKV